jgi:hypothetical protein
MQKGSSLYGPVFYTGMGVLFLALFLLNACTRGTMLGLISTGGLALLMAYIAYRGWSRERLNSATPPPDTAPRR